MKTFYLTDSGKVRDHNEDSVTILHEAKDCNETSIVIQIRYQKDGVKQLYLDYKDIIYCYNLI